MVKDSRHSFRKPVAHDPNSLGQIGLRWPVLFEPDTCTCDRRAHLHRARGDLGTDGNNIVRCLLFLRDRLDGATTMCNLQFFFFFPWKGRIRCGAFLQTTNRI